MKRPQFSIRLLLLIVALAAVLMAWRAAIWQIERSDRNRRIELLENDIKNNEVERDYFLKTTGPTIHVEMLEADLVEQRKALEELKK